MHKLLIALAFTCALGSCNRSPGGLQFLNMSSDGITVHYSAATDPTRDLVLRLEPGDKSRIQSAERPADLATLRIERNGQIQNFRNWQNERKQNRCKAACKVIIADHQIFIGSLD